MLGALLFDVCHEWSLQCVAYALHVNALSEINETGACGNVGLTNGPWCSCFRCMSDSGVTNGLCNVPACVCVYSSHMDATLAFVMVQWCVET